MGKSGFAERNEGEREDNLSIHRSMLYPIEFLVLEALHL
jgi:hypothetical protein